MSERAHAAEERGFLLGATVLGLSPEAAGFLTDPHGEFCAAALGRLGSLDREPKAQELAHLARDISAPYPPFMRDIHASWLVPLLSPEPSDLIPALVAGAPQAAREAAQEVMNGRSGEPRATEPVVLPAEVAAELRRYLFAGLGEAPPAGGPLISKLLEMSGPALQKELRRLGARSLGATLAKAAPELRARAMASVGAELAAELCQAAETADRVERAEAESDVKGAAADLTGTVEERLLAIGVSALLRLIRSEPPASRVALAHRLPRKLGRRLLPFDKNAPNPAAKYPPKKTV